MPASPNMLTTLSSAAALFTLFTTTTHAYNLQPTEECPILGPIFPPSTFSIPSSSAFDSAVATFPDTIQALFDAEVIDPSTSTFALDVYSTETNSSIYSHFHLATGEGANDTLSAGVLDDETVFRTGSVSKLHAVYAIILAGGKGLDVFSDKVVKWVPELLQSAEELEDFDPLTQIKWDEITIGALVNQQGGVSAPCK